VNSSAADPPKSVEYTSDVPFGASFTRNASSVPRNPVCKPPTVGKSPEVVPPATTALPVASTAMPCGFSKPLPPKIVEYTIDEPDGSIFVTKAFTELTLADNWPPAVTGKPRPSVSPVT